MTRWLPSTAVAALIVFAGVQDRRTADGVGRYVAAYREAEAAGTQLSVTIDDVMEPSVANAVRQGALWAGGVLITGMAAGAFVRSGRRE